MNEIKKSRKSHSSCLSLRRLGKIECAASNPATLEVARHSESYSHGQNLLLGNRRGLEPDPRASNEKFAVPISSVQC